MTHERSTRHAAALFSGLLALVLAACGPEGEKSATPDVASRPAQTGPLNFSGMYAVSGLTVEKESGAQREISGTIILAQDEGRYTSTFNLKTVFPSPDGPLHTNVIGSGEGTVEGQVLRGSAHTQLVVARVPGVDPGFAFAPRMVGARIVSTSVARLEPDGTLTVQIETKPEEGEVYTPTTTTLHGSYLPSRRSTQ